MKTPTPSPAVTKVKKSKKNKSNPEESAPLYDKVCEGLEILEQENLSVDDFR